MINNVLEVSTSHITASTNDWIDNMVKSPMPGFMAHPTGYGWMIPVLHYKDMTHITNIPRDLIALIYYAKGNDCSWISIERNGDIEKELPYYEW
jgi:hypothetical protein